MNDASAQDCALPGRAYGRTVRTRSCQVSISHTPAPEYHSARLFPWAPLGTGRHLLGVRDLRMAG